MCVPNDSEGGPFNELASEENNTYFQQENINIKPDNFDGLENIKTNINNGTL